MLPIATGLSLAALYDEQEENAPTEPASSSDRPRWTLLQDYDRVTPSDLKWELMLGRVRISTWDMSDVAHLPW